MKKYFFYFICSFFIIVLFFSLTCQQSFAQELTKTQETILSQPLFFKIKMNKQHCGWLSSQELFKDNQIITLEKTVFQLQRFEDVVENTQIVRITEDKEGYIIKEVHKNTDATGKIEIQQLEVNPQNPYLLTITTHTNGKEKEIQQIQISERLLGPNKIKQILKKQKPYKVGDKIEFSVFNLEFLQMSYHTLTFKKVDKIFFSGKEQEIYIFDTTETIKDIIIKGEVHLLNTGDEFFSVNDFLNISSESQLVTTQEEATNNIKATTALDDSMLKAPNIDKIIKQNPQGIRYYIEDKTDFFPSIINDINQKIEKIKNKPHMWTLEVYNKKPTTKMNWPYSGNNKEALKAIQPAFTLEIKDPQILQLAIKMTGEKKSGDDAFATAEKISHYVFHYIINKNYEHGYESALQTLKNRSGDCTEHSVLAVALCRAIGIPARPVFGLAYSRQQVSAGYDEDFFVGHQWFEVWINGQWFPLDSALYNFSLGHIRLGHGNGDQQDSFKILQGYEKTKSIKIQKVEAIIQ